MTFRSVFPFFIERESALLWLAVGSMFEVSSLNVGLIRSPEAEVK